jgi:hypothetical protein
MPRKAPKKKPASKKKLSWHEEGELLLKNYLKRFKGPKAAIAVLNSYGDLLLRSGKSEHLDWTSLGSVFSAVKAAAENLNKQLSNKGSVVQFGDFKRGYWIEWHPGNSFLVGIGIPYQHSSLASLKKHLKAHTPAISKTQGREALDGMSEETIDAALETEIS